MDLFIFSILILAAFRLTSLLVNEAGLFDIFLRIRQIAGVYLDELSEPQADNVIGKVLTCVWCCSVWVGIGLATAWYFWPGYTFWLCLPLALSAGAILIDERLVGNE